MRRALAVALAVLAAAGAAHADEVSRQELARELARVMLDEPVRRGLDDEVAAAMIRAIGGTLQVRLNRRLQDVEWRQLAEIVRRFVAGALPGGRSEEIAARVYARHFDEAELRDLLRFQESPVGRKAARLAPVIGAETARAIEAELQDHPLMPSLVRELQGAFPVLGAPESP
jgi:hypothetical protein